MDDPNRQKIIILTAPSGSGKTTIMRALLEQITRLRFSVSATTRPPRKGEVNGVDYHFLSVEDFERKIEEDAFSEYEMVYQNKFYGTLKTKLSEIWLDNNIPLVDIDVQGAKKLKLLYGADALSIFIQAPSLEILEERLTQRGTDSKEMIQERLEKAASELAEKHHFDTLVVNDKLDVAIEACVQKIKSFLN